MALVNITQAANIAGITKSTLYKHIKQGKVTSCLTPDGNKAIDTNELARVYGVLTATVAADTNDGFSQLQLDNDRLRSELHEVRGLFVAKDTYITALKRQVLLLEQAAEQEKFTTKGHPPAAAWREENTGSLWGKIFRRMRISFYQFLNK